MKVFEGTVVSTALPKTAKVKVERRMAHPVYGKSITRSNTFMCHCEMEVNVGDKVKIRETRSMSARKRFIVLEKI